MFHQRAGMRKVSAAQLNLAQYTVRMRETQRIVRLTVQLSRCLCPNQCLINVSLQEMYLSQAQIGIGLSKFVVKRKRGSECIGKKRCCSIKLQLLIEIDTSKAELSVNATEHIIG